MKKRLLSAVLCLAMVASMLAGCGAKEEAPAETAAKTEAKAEEKAEAKTEEKAEEKAETPANRVAGIDGVLTYAIGGDTGNTLNPITADDRWGLMTCHLVYSPAYYINQDGTVDYILAESMEADETGLVYTMKLKDGLLWSDGEALTADDIVYSYESTNATNGNLFVDEQPIAVEKIDDLTVQFTLPAVCASAFELLSSEVSIIPKHIFEEKGSFDINMLEETVVGAGPYKLAEYSTGQYLKFTKNENYGGDLANIDTIVFKIIESNDTATLALQNGEIDIWVGAPDMLDPYNGNDAFNITNYSEGRVAYMRVNPGAESMKDKNYREGILRAVNREEIMTAAYTDPSFYELGYSFLPYTNAYYTEDVEKWEQDVEKAKELTAGGATELKICYVGEDAVQTNMALTIQAELKAIGINLELCGLNQAAYMAAAYDITNTEYDMYLGGYVMGIDPDMYSSLFMTSKRNMMFYDSDKIDQLFIDGNATLDEAERKAIYNEVQKAVSEEAIFYPFGTNLRTIVTNARVGGLDDAKFAAIYTFGNYAKLTLE